MVVKDFNPLEDDECIAFSDWLKANNIPHCHIANESRSSSKSAMIRGAKLKRMGQSRGVWDYEVFIPIRGISGQIDCYEMVKIEMKRRKGGIVSEEQKTWGKIYELSGIPCKICKGADEAIKFIKSYLKFDDYIL
ncbi:MAG: hypothetical protein J6Z11_12340 [Candidatus Riflebacteria bacterium]|nr:hypothetical protein [Candidatus Riflebacteria bacterium]